MRRFLTVSVLLGARILIRPDFLGSLNLCIFPVLLTVMLNDGCPLLVQIDLLGRGVLWDAISHANLSCDSSSSILSSASSLDTALPSYFHA